MGGTAAEGWVARARGVCSQLVAAVKLVSSTQPLLTEDGIFAFILQECDWCQVVFLEANHGQANVGRGMKKSQDALTDPFG